MRAGRRPAARRWVVFGVLVAGGWMSVALLVALDFGRADNGDFSRYNGRWIRGPQEDPRPWPTTDREWRERWRHQGWTRLWKLRERPPPGRLPRDAGSTPWLWAPALEVARLASADGNVDLRWVSALPRALVLLAGLALAAGVARSAFESRRRAVLLAIVPWSLLLSSSWATSFLNSFFRESGAFAYATLLLATVAVAGAWCSDRIARWTVAGSGVLLALSAPAHGPLAFVSVAALGWTERARRPERTAAERWKGSAWAVLLLVAAGVWSTSAVRPAVQEAGAFNALFFGVLPLSGQLDRHLEHLPGGVAEASPLVGHHAFSEVARGYLDKHGGELSHGEVFRAMAREPRLVLRAAVASAGMLGGTRIGRAELRPQGEQTSSAASAVIWNVYGEALSAARGHGLATLLWLLASLLAGAWLATGEEPGAMAAGRVLAVSALGALVDAGVNFAGDGAMEGVRHYLVANTLLGATFAAAIWAILLAAPRRRKRQTTPAARSTSSSMSPVRSES